VHVPCVVVFGVASPPSDCSWDCGRVRTAAEMHNALSHGKQQWGGIVMGYSLLQGLASGMESLCGQVCGCAVGMCGGSAWQLTSGVIVNNALVT
jgi:hypothetical protein